VEKRKTGRRDGKRESGFLVTVREKTGKRDDGF